MRKYWFTLVKFSNFTHDIGFGGVKEITKFLTYALLGFGWSLERTSIMSTRTLSSLYENTVTLINIAISFSNIYLSYILHIWTKDVKEIINGTSSALYPKCSKFYFRKDIDVRR